MGTWKIEQPERLTLDDKVERVNVYLLHGRLNIVGTDGPPRVEITSIANRPVTVRLENGTLSVVNDDVPKWPGILWWLFGRKFRVDVSIAVPRTAPATLNVVSGSIVASALRAGATVDMTSGRITLLGLDGTIRAKVISGPIEALSIGGRLELETVSGEITLADSTAREVRARTISGSITCDLDNPHANSEIRLETTSGEITARVREDSDLRVQLHAISGRVTCAFPELASGGTKSVAGVLGAGTGQLSANAVSGNIALLRRPVDYDDDEGGVQS
jgi:DUF4097 and DUF4098 domain-containing protein YvlB